MEEVYSIHVVEGPSKSGKSTTIQQLINGRPNTVYLSVREKNDEIPILVAETFGCIGDKKENMKGKYIYIYIYIKKRLINKYNFLIY